MSSFYSKIRDELRHAFKQGETLKVATLRLLQAAIHNVEIERHKKDTGLSDGEITEVVGREVKRRREAAELYAKGGRSDLAEKEKGEAAILEAYLPAHLSEAEIQAVIREVLDGGERNPGKVMGQVMARVKGRADGAAVRKMVEEMLKQNQK